MDLPLISDIVGNQTGRTAPQPTDYDTCIVELLVDQLSPPVRRRFCIACRRRYVRSRCWGYAGSLRNRRCPHRR